MALVVAYISLEINELFAFLKHPRRGSGRAAHGNAWIGRAIFFAVLLTVIEAPILIIFDGVQRWANTPRLTIIPRDLFAAMFLIVVLGPIIEELIFRAGLRKITYSLFLGPLAIVLFAVNTFTGLMVFVALCLFVAVVGIMHARSMVKNHTARLRFMRLFITNYARIFWLYCFLFAFLHITTFQLNGPWSLLVFILVLPQFISGVVMGYLRLRDGLRSSCLMHSLMNFFAFLAISIGGQ